jgi:PAS domain S-box-containing protein
MLAPSMVVKAMEERVRDALRKSLRAIRTPRNTEDEKRTSAPNEPGERRRLDRRQLAGRRGAERQRGVRPHVLLIEPHDDTRLLYTNVFEDAGYAVYSVTHGAEALAVAQFRLPDLILMEVVIPGVDGLTILQALRADLATSDIPVIVVTATLHYHLPERARASGAVIVLGKPTPIDGLFAAADDLIRGTPPARLARRQLRRALLTIRKVAAASATPDERTRERVRALIDRLQVAVLAMDDDGRYLAASPGVESLTGYTRAELLSMSVFDAALGATLPLARLRDHFISSEHEMSETTINNKMGGRVPIHASFATVLPGLHAAVFAPADTQA